MGKYSKTLDMSQYWFEINVGFLLFKRLILSKLNLMLNFFVLSFHCHRYDIMSEGTFGEGSSMKKWEKGLLSVAVAAGLIILTACSLVAKEQKVRLEKEENGVKIILTYYAKGDKVMKQTSENIIPYSEIGVKTADEAKEQLEEVAKSYNKLKGVRDQLVYGEDSVTEKVVVDYRVVDKVNAMKLTAMMADDGNLSKGVSLKSSIKLLKEQGFKEEK